MVPTRAPTIRLDKTNEKHLFGFESILRKFHSSLIYVIYKTKIHAWGILKYYSNFFESEFNSSLTTGSREILSILNTARVFSRAENPRARVSCAWEGGGGGWNGEKDGSDIALFFSSDSSIPRFPD